MRSGLVRALFLGFLIVGMPSICLAAPYVWVDYVDFQPDILVGGSGINPFSYTHDLTDNSVPFVPGIDKISDYSLQLRLYDDGGRWDGWEVAFVNQPGLLGDGFYNFSYSNNTFGWSFAGRTQLNSQGKLSVSIESWHGDFLVDWSKLTASGQSNTAPVPEPATVLLMGAGLAGMGIVRRFMKPKN